MIRAVSYFTNRKQKLLNLLLDISLSYLISSVPCCQLSSNLPNASQVLMCLLKVIPSFIIIAFWYINKSLFVAAGWGMNKMLDSTKNGIWVWYNIHTTKEITILYNSSDLGFSSNWSLFAIILFDQIAINENIYQPLRNEIATHLIGIQR